MEMVTEKLFTVCLYVFHSDVKIENKQETIPAS